MFTYATESNDRHAPASNVKENETSLPHDKHAQQPSFPGPGASATAASPPKPHSSRLLNKLDPRLNQDILDKVDKERQRDKKEQEEFEKMLSGESEGKMTEGKEGKSKED